MLREGSSHTIIRRERDGFQMVVPRHSELKRGTVRGMATDAQINWDEFKRDIS